MAEKERSMRDELAQERTDLAIQRTSMAADRSLMAWIRTALSMIGFGFTIFKFLQYVRDDIVEITLRQQLPRNLGLFLIGLGTLSMIYGSIQYMLTMKSIPAQSRHSAWRFPIIAACSIAALGLFLFITMVLRIEFI
jgi:putative membrane protein